MQTKGMRLNHYIARAGLASRRGADDLIVQGKVSINGRVNKTLGVQIHEGDEVTVEGKRIQAPTQFVYYALNKPKRYVSTLHDPDNKPCVVDLVPKEPRVNPVGRLDEMSQGLLLLTNDGDFIYRMTHPKHRIYKTYRVKVRGMLTAPELQALRKGVPLKDGKTKPAEVEVVSRQSDISEFKIAIREGRNRQIRRMCQAINHSVLFLERTAIGNLELGELPLGTWRSFNPQEIG